MQRDRDPLNLGSLPTVSPPTDDWPLIEAALSTLDREDRAVVWLHDVEGYKHKEIAGLFGKTESFSKTRLSRARTKLRAVLDRQMNLAEFVEMGSATP